MICALCGSDNTYIQARMPDDRGIVRIIHGCSRCAALTPDYCIAAPLDTSSQIAFHERYWQEVDGPALQRELAELAGVVASLRPHLGVPAAGKRVLEIGAGRGGLLRALRDAGYEAYGCEPAPDLVAIAREHYGLEESALSNIDVSQMLQFADAGYAVTLLWHVIEHLNNPMDILSRVSSVIDPGGAIIIQVPLLKSSYIYPEHYYFCSHDTFAFIAMEIGFGLVDVIYDEENMFATAVFRKGIESTPVAFLDYESVPDALSQLVILNERSRAAYRDVASDERSGLLAWEKLAEDRLAAMTAMEQLINDGLEAIATQAAMIDQRDLDAAAWESLAEDRLAAMTAMEQLINDGLAAMATQAAMIDRRDLDVAALRERVGELELANIEGTVVGA